MCNQENVVLQLKVKLLGGPCDCYTVIHNWIITCSRYIADTLMYKQYFAIIVGFSGANFELMCIGLHLTIIFIMD